MLYSIAINVSNITIMANIYHDIDPWPRMLSALMHATIERG